MKTEVPRDTGAVALLEDVSAAESAAAAAWLTLAVLLATAYVAWRQVREAVRLRRAQTRPFVVVQYDFRNILVMVGDCCRFG